MKRLLSGASFVLSVSWMLGSASASPATTLSIGESLDKVGTIELPSGMRIVIEEDHSKPVVALVAVISGGAADDPVGKEGLAHLVEHLTARAKPDGRIQRSNLLDFAGAASWNGATTHDVTTYGVVGPKEALRNLLVIEGGRLAGPLAGLDAHVFEVERDNVKAELAERDEQGAPGAVQTKLYQALYPEGHRYHRPVLGTMKSVSELSVADAQAFVEKYYVPSNVTLYVAGDLELSTIHQVFGATLPKQFIEAPASGPVRPPVRLSKETPAVPPTPATQAVAAVQAPVAGPMLYISWSLPRGYSADGTLERAVRSAIEAVPIWVSATSDIKDIRATLVAGRDSSTLVCAVALKEGRNPEKSLERVLDQFHRFSDPSTTKSGQEENSELGPSNLFARGFAPPINAQTGTTFTGSMGSGNNSVNPHMNANGAMPLSPSINGDYTLAVQNNRSAEGTVPVRVSRYQMTALVGDVVETESVLGRAVDRATLAHWTGDSEAWGKDMTALTEVGPSTWQNFTLQWLSRDRARVVFVEPNGESIEANDSGGPPSVFAADDARVKISSGALKTYAHGPAGEARSVTLKNGLQVLLVRRLGAPTVAATVGVRGGSATAEPLGVAQLASRLAVPLQVNNGPPSSFGGNLALVTGPDASYLEGRAASGNLAALLAVLSDTAQSLHVDDGLAERWNDLVDGRHRFDVSPSAEADRKFLAEVYPGSTLGRTAQAADFQKLGTRDINRWIDESFRPGNAVLAVVGDINLSETEEQVRKLFEGWKGERAPQAEAAPGKIRERPGPVRLLTVDRPGAERTEIRLGCGIEPQSPTDLLAIRMLGARLRTKLGTLARTTLGGSEGFAGGATLSRAGARVDVAGAVDSRALTPVLVAARSELAALDDLTLGEDELALLKWRQAMGWNTRYTTNVELARGLVWARLAELPADLLQTYGEALAAVTPEDVSRVAIACRKTAVLLLSGDPGVVDRALFVTDGMMLRKGPQN